MKSTSTTIEGLISKKRNLDLAVLRSPSPAAPAHIPAIFLLTSNKKSRKHLKIKRQETQSLQPVNFNLQLILESNRDTNGGLLSIE